MRGIKFRGKVLKEGVWLTGSLLFINDAYYIYMGDSGDLGDTDFGYAFEEVVFETVGQYTSMKDKAGKDIYEGDLVRNFLTCNYGLSKMPPVYEVVFKDAGFGFLADPKHGEYNRVSNRYLPGELTRPGNWEIIGNIHDNPELLTSNIKEK